ncbi:integrase [Sporosarcina sp. Te-1]|uniref:integrase n=1 Tax=Sporosarcina sp. Te-1 TaxID=2818390 RepID=UPI001A9CD1B8|nr:integrase [Sporosarcina sp. Te-1]QTD39660.1 integrase [Sporosarcina sp. Te-1]
MRRPARQIQELVEQTIRDVEMDVAVKQEQTGVNMMYDFIQHEVLIDMGRIRKACGELPEPMSFETYIRTLTIHELGHAMDRDALLASLDRAVEIIKAKKQACAEKRNRELPFMEMLIEEHERDIVFEETAWSNAELLNRYYEVIDWQDFLKVKEHSLASYRTSYEKDLNVYQEMKVAQDSLAII